MIRIHVIANVLLLLLGYYWLGVGESSGGRLVWSALLLLILFAGALWTYGGSLASYRDVVRHLLPLAIVAIVALVIYALLHWWRVYSEQPAFQIASY
jgi:hypothetical protein